MASVLDDLMAETAILDGILAGLPPGGWDQPTPAERWLVRDQVAHLAGVDALATVAATDPDAWPAEVAKAVESGPGFVDDLVMAERHRSPDDLLVWFRSARAEMVGALGRLDPKDRIPWFGPSMSAVSFATARIMETWAHGQDVADAVGAAWPASNRIRHVAEIGVRAMPNAFRTHGLAVPETPVRVELIAPDASLWAWGPEDAADRVSGPALDFCLVVTRRRHRDDTALVADGPVAGEWLSIAQAFAGPPGNARPSSNAV